MPLTQTFLAKKKADFMMGFKDRKREVFLFFVELKRPGKVSKYQVEDDFVKLIKHMKNSICKKLVLSVLIFLESLSFRV